MVRKDCDVKLDRLKEEVERRLDVVMWEVNLLVSLKMDEERRIVLRKEVRDWRCCDMRLLEVMRRRESELVEGRCREVVEV